MSSKTGIPYTRTPYLVIYDQPAGKTKEVYGAVGDRVAVQAQLMRGAHDASTVLVTMHPIGSQAYLPIFSGLARAGHHVIACANRYTSGDFSLQYENLMLDLAACVRDARERLGYERVVLVGWSGGGSVIAGYQAEAEQKRVSHTAAGEYTPLADTDLIPADAVLLMAPHRSRHHLLTDFLDPSILDERDPDTRDPELDLYNPANPNQPPYAPEFLERYRAAQKARNRRITRWVESRLARLRDAGRDGADQAFVVHGTLADPRWLDLTIEPNERSLGSHIGDPAAGNDGLSSLARYTSLRSWLSQWSFDRAQFDAVEAAPRISVPVLVVVNGADDACPVSHTDDIFAALGAQDKAMHVVPGADHYYTGPAQRPKLEQAIALVNDWLAARRLDDRPVSSAAA